MDKKDLDITFTSTTQELLNLLKSVGTDKFNQVPFEGSWTAAQVGDHLLKSYGVVETLKGNTSATERPADEKVKQIEDVFLDFTVKFQSPEFIIPATEPLDKDHLINALTEKINLMTQYAREQDLSPTCLDFELPGFGKMTRFEWLYFVRCHTYRHNRQLKRILENLDSSDD